MIYAEKRSAGEEVFQDEVSSTGSLRDVADVEEVGTAGIGVESISKESLSIAC